MNHALYGVKKKSLAQVGQAVSTALSVDFVERESDYLGIYMSGMIGAIKVRVVSQPDPEGELLEPDFAEWGILIYLDGSEELPSLENLEFEGGEVRVLRI